MEQLQHRITQFQDSFPKIEKFYKEFSKLIVVDETLNDPPLDEEQLFNEFNRSIENHFEEEQEKVRLAEEERLRVERERLAKEQEEREAKQRAEEEAARAREEAAAVRLENLSPFSRRISLFFQGRGRRSRRSTSCRSR